MNIKINKVYETFGGYEIKIVDKLAGYNNNYFYLGKLIRDGLLTSSLLFDSCGEAICDSDSRFCLVKEKVIPEEEVINYNTFRATIANAEFQVYGIPNKVATIKRKHWREKKVLLNHKNKLEVLPKGSINLDAEDWYVESII